MALRDLDIDSVTARYRRRVAAVAPEGLEMATRVLERLDPARWTLEWFLPWWLGDHFGLDRAISGEIVLSNVLGLASIRLQDDLADGDVEVDHVPVATMLSAVLYDEAVATYRQLFDGGSAFWERLPMYMAEWRAASGEGAQELAGRGAPLKISAFATCLLAGRLERFSALEEALDHALAALVLDDHLADWQDDLDAGRWNVFIARHARLPQVPANRDRNRSAVLMAMVSGDAVTDHVDVTEAELAAAIAAAEVLGLTPLAEHLRGYAARAASHGVILQARYRDAADRAARILMGVEGKGGSRDD